MYELDSDGTLFYNDEETGEKIVVGSISEEVDDDDDDDDNDDDNDEDDDLFKGLSDSERLEKISEMLLSEELKTQDIGYGASTSNTLSGIHVGETIACYVKSVSPQSGRFSLTLNPTPLSLKDEKQIAIVNKRVEKLQASGDLDKIQTAKGEVKEGTVVAVSKADVRMFYVKVPGLPVGVATYEGDIHEVKEGEKVSVKVLGLDGERGQMGCQVVQQ
mmetsp:Transcript_9471/g.19250  ORF Transcript_9471/g.19250 Transcript_9471/m.19250 type:complete len:217 (-) Transcript_9471:37-687(-)